MNKNIVIGGVILSVLGVGAYLYYKKNKSGSKLDNNSSLLSSLLPTTDNNNNDNSEIKAIQDAIASGQPVPSSGTTLTNPTQVAQVVNKMEEARALTTKIADTRKKILPLPYPNLNCTQKLLLNAIDRSNCGWNNLQKITNDKYQKEIDLLLTQVTALGYTELNGQPVKIG